MGLPGYTQCSMRCGIVGGLAGAATKRRRPASRALAFAQRPLRVHRARYARGSAAGECASTQQAPAQPHAGAVALE